MRWTVLLASMCAGCAASPPATPVAGGDVQRGAVLFASYGCGACHVMPGVDGARGQVGPPLGGFRQRSFIAGRLPNVADSLVRWLVSPQRYEPGGAMPDLGVTEPEARDMAAFLYDPP